MNEVLGAWFERVDVSHARQKSRVLTARAPRDRRQPPALGWPRGERHDDLGVTLVGHGGVFAGTGVDIGTRFLLEQLGDAVPDAATAVDLACGSGIVAAWLAHARPALRVTATDRSARRPRHPLVQTAEVNGVADRIRVTQADGLELLPDASEPLIVLNPPFHSDAALHTGIAAHLFEDAARVLAPGGELWCVWNSHLRYRPLLERLVGRDPAGGAQSEVHRDRIDSTVAMIEWSGSIRIRGLAVCRFARPVVARHNGPGATRRPGGDGMSEQERLARDLRLAAERGEIIAQYQPQVDLRDGLLVALEALSRWRHPSAWPHPAPRVHPARGGDRRDHRRRRRHARGGLPVRLGARAGRSPDRGRGERGRRSALRGAIRGTGDPPPPGLRDARARCSPSNSPRSRPVPPEAAEALAGVRAIGVGVSVDDVRTVEEAEARVRALPITELKVDRSVIRRLPEDRAVAAQLVGFAREHGLRSVAEGVETRPQLVALREIGFDRAQGYLFGRPVPARRISARLAVGSAAAP